VEQLCARLADRFRLLTAGARTAVPRQQTLRATLDWSHALLGEHERAVLRRLAIFPGSFTMDAASAVAAGASIDEFAVIDVLSQLVSRSLVMADTAADAARYRLLETTRAYAQEKLAEAGETSGVRRRHAWFFRDAFERVSADWLRLSDRDWHATYAPELANIRAALDWAFAGDGDSELGIALAGASGPLWSTLGLFGEGVHRLERAAARIDSSTPAAYQARLWNWLGRLLDEAPARARPALEHAVELYRRLGDGLGLGISLARLGRVLTLMGEFAHAEAALSEARPLLARVALPQALDYYFFNFAFLKAFTGDLPCARANYEQSLAIGRDAGNEFSVLATIGNLANVNWALGDLDAAAASLRELQALARSSRVSTRRLLGFALMNLAGVLVEKGAVDEALSLQREGLPLVKESGSAWLFADHVALRAARAGKLQSAGRLAGYADSVHAANGAARQFIEARTRDRLAAVLREKLPADEVDRLLAEGARMSEDEACRLALEA
jgi:tetratricopeptide (TPR) repeat protein